MSMNLKRVDIWNLTQLGSKLHCWVWVWTIWESKLLDVLSLGPPRALDVVHVIGLHRGHGIKPHRFFLFLISQELWMLCAGSLFSGVYSGYGCCAQALCSLQLIQALDVVRRLSVLCRLFRLWMLCTGAGCGAAAPLCAFCSLPYRQVYITANLQRTHSVDKMSSMTCDMVCLCCVSCHVMILVTSSSLVCLPFVRIPCNSHDSKCLRIQWWNNPRIVISSYVV